MSNDNAGTHSANPVSPWNVNVVEEFRTNGGQLSGQFEGAPVLLLHTTGAKSGHERINPMMYLDYEGRMFVFASKASAHTNPDWFHNLIANPLVTVEQGAEIFTASAVALGAEERSRIFAVQAERYPGFSEYEAKTPRVIPVVELRRVD